MEKKSVLTITFPQYYLSMLTLNKKTLWDFLNQVLKVFIRMLALCDRCVLALTLMTHTF